MAEAGPNPALPCSLRFLTPPQPPSVSWGSRSHHQGYLQRLHVLAATLMAPISNPRSVGGAEGETKLQSLAPASCPLGHPQHSTLLEVRGGRKWGKLA